MREKKNLLPDVPETPKPRYVDALRLPVWMVRGYAYSVYRAPRAREKWTAAEALFLLVVLVPGVFVLPAVFGLMPWVLGLLVGGVAGFLYWVVLGFVLLFWGKRRGYMTKARDAVLVVHEETTNNVTSWTVENFFAARPKRTKTADLWHKTLPALASIADDKKVTIHATAMNDLLAQHYCTDDTGFKVVEVYATGRVRLRRDPKSK